MRSANATSSVSSDTSTPSVFRLYHESFRRIAGVTVSLQQHSSKFDFETVNDSHAATKRVRLISTPATDKMGPSSGPSV